MAFQVGIVGASGYGGVELLRLAAAHPALDVAVVAAHSQAGERVDALFPNLPGARTFDAVDVDQLVGLDLVFLAAPHGPALELAPALVAGGAKVVDLSAAFRLPPDDFARWYGEDHPAPALAPLPDGTHGRDRAAYGLTEHARDAVRSAALVANPGCYPTAALVGLLPLVPLLLPGTIVIDAKSGTSGAGRAATDSLHFSHVHGDLAAYGAPAHRHTGEIERWLSVLGGTDLGPVSFTPHLVPMVRGLLATSYAGVRDDVTATDVQGALLDAYRDEPFVTVLEPGVFPHTKALAGSNGVQVSAVVDERTRRVVVTAAEDNLGKGAAGQATQNANLLLGIDEGAGLSTIGVYP